MRFATTRRSFVAGAVALALAPAYARSAWPTKLPSRPRHAPRPSDVCFSNRFGKYKGLPVAKAFHANRLDWCYSTDAKLLNAAHEAGLKTLGGALNSTLSDQVGGRSTELGRALDKDGRKIVAPWMKAWGKHWGCVNSPQYPAIFLAHARAGLEAGIDWFVIDAPFFNVNVVKWGGCYCRYCQAAARREGLDLERDMAEFQKRSVIRFYDTVRQDLDRLAGRHVTLASNNGVMNAPGRLDAPYGKTDFGMSEVGEERVDPAKIAAVLNAGEEMGRPQTLTLVSTQSSLNRRLAAWCYANGGHLIAPWDVYISATPPKRFYGDPADYADIYGFARELGPLLDDAAPAGQPPPDAWASTLPGVQASLRASPRQEFAVLHLVAWRGESPSTLTVDPERLLPGGRRVAEARVRTPFGDRVALERRGAVLAADVPAETWLAVEMLPG